MQQQNVSNLLKSFFSFVFDNILAGYSPWGHKESDTTKD